MDYYANSSLGIWTVNNEANRPVRVRKPRSNIGKKGSSECSDKVQDKLTEEKQHVMNITVTEEKSDTVKLTVNPQISQECCTVNAELCQSASSSDVCRHKATSDVLHSSNINKADT
jgi:hypothetical protein